MLSRVCDRSWDVYCTQYVHVHVGVDRSHLQCTHLQSELRHRTRLLYGSQRLHVYRWLVRPDVQYAGVQSRLRSRQLHCTQHVHVR